MVVVFTEYKGVDLNVYHYRIYEVKVCKNIINPENHCLWTLVEIVQFIFV